MALFSSKNKTVKKTDALKVSQSANNFSYDDKSNVLIRPRITEKATDQSLNKIYIFEILADANKAQVAKAVNFVYKVKPISVRIAKTPAKTVFVRGKSGYKSGIKKAYVQLKKGDKIDFV